MSTNISTIVISCVVLLLLIISTWIEIEANSSFFRIRSNTRSSTFLRLLLENRSNMDKIITTDDNTPLSLSLDSNGIQWNKKYISIFLLTDNIDDDDIDIDMKINESCFNYNNMISTRNWIDIRGGGRSFNDDDDEFYDDYDEFLPDKIPSSPSRNASSRSRRYSKSSSMGGDLKGRGSHRSRSDFRPPTDGRRMNNRKSSKSSGVIQSLTGTTKSITSKTANLAVASVRESTKAAVNFASPKHVSIRHVAGVWRLDQTVGKPGKSSVKTCAANIRLDTKGNLSTTYDGKEMKSKYTFIERSWPRYCSIEFEARAFQGPSDPEPVNMFYKGYFTRKVMDRSIIKIEGKIYALRGRGIFQKKVHIGTFTARKRLGRLSQEELSQMNSGNVPNTGKYKINNDEKEQEEYYDDYDADINSDSEVSDKDHEYDSEGFEEYEDEY